MSQEGDFRFDRIVRDVAAMCPALEDLEVVYVKRFHVSRKAIVQKHLS